MKNYGINLLVLSFAFLCTDNCASQLFAKSNESSITENYLDSYLNDNDNLSNNTLKQKKQTKRQVTIQNDDDSLDMSGDSQLRNRNNQMNTGDDTQMTNRNRQMNRQGQPACPSQPKPKKCASACDCEAICCPEIIEDCCECNICPPICPITPKANPCVDCGLNIYGTVDFIYWTAREQGTAFGATSGFRSFGTGTPVSGTPTGKVIQPHNKWRPGFKIGLGIDFCHDGWDLYTQYTWFRSNSGSRSTTINGVPSLVGTLLSAGPGITGTTLSDSYWGIATGAPQFFGGVVGNVDAAGATPVAQPMQFQTVRGSWNLHFNVIDLELGRNFYISPRLTLRPHFGLKGTWQKQQLHVSFSNPVTALGAFFTNDPSNSVNMRNKFSNWGIGPRAGINTAWHFYRLFSLVGDIAVTGLLDHFSATRFDTRHEVVGGVVSNDSAVHLKNSFYTFAPVVEWMLGFRFEKWTLHNDYHFAFDAGWESQHWLFQNQFIRAYSAESNNGTLGMHGLTLKARFDF